MMYRGKCYFCGDEDALIESRGHACPGMTEEDWRARERWLAEQRKSIDENLAAWARAF